MGAVAAAIVYLSLGADIKAEVTGLNLFWVCWGDRPSLLTCFCCVNKLSHSLSEPLRRRRLILQTHVLQPTAPIREDHPSTEIPPPRNFSRAQALRGIPKLYSNFFCSLVKCHLHQLLCRMEHSTSYITIIYARAYMTRGATERFCVGQKNL